MWSIVAWAATAGGLLGAGLIAAGKPWHGQVVWCVANPLWVAWAVACGAPPTAVLFTVYTGIVVVGVLRGYRKGGVA